MSSSIVEIIIHFFVTFIVFIVLPMISDFFTIGLGQAFAMALGMSLIDLIAYLIKKAIKNKKR